MATTSDNELAGKMKALCREERVSPPRKFALMLSLQRMVYALFIFPRTTALATGLFRWLTKKGMVVGSSSTSEFVPEMADDFFMGMSSGQARAGLRQMRKIEKNLAHRRRMAQLYGDLLREAGWDVPDVPDCMDPVLVRYPVRVADKALAVARAPGRFIELGTWFECPLHPIETPMHLYDYEDGMCPVAEQACREVVNLPTHARAGENTGKRNVQFLGDLRESGDDSRKELHA